MFRNLQMQLQRRSVVKSPARRSLYLAMVLTSGVGLWPLLASAQTTGSSSVSGTVTDQSGAVVPGATVVIQNPVSQYTRTTTTDDAGKFTFANVPINPYHMTVNITGFAPYVQDIDVRSAVPMSLKVALQISGKAENVTVQAEAGDLIENDPTFHTDIDRQLFSKLPLESTSSELSSLVGNGLAVQRKRVFRVIAQSVHEAVGIGCNTRR